MENTFLGRELFPDSTMTKEFIQGDIGTRQLGQRHFFINLPDGQMPNQLFFTQIDQLGFGQILGPKT